VNYPENSTNPFGAPTTPPVEYYRVGFGKRLLAFLIDGLITMTLVVGAAILVMTLGIPTGGFIESQLDDIATMYDIMGIPTSAIENIRTFLGGILVSSLVMSFFYPLIEGITGASPGKRVLRIMVANADGTAGNTTVYLRRFAVKNISNILQIVALLPGLAFFEGFGFVLSLVIFFGCFAVLGASRMALHDIIAQTAVFHREDIR
jgi:uncharacterized RDD family membrane protein YckC